MARDATSTAFLLSLFNISPSAKSTVAGAVFGQNTAAPRGSPAATLQAATSMLRASLGQLPAVSGSTPTTAQLLAKVA